MKKTVRDDESKRDDDTLKTHEDVTPEAEERGSPSLGRGVLRKLITSVVLLLILLLSVIVVNTTGLTSKQMEVAAPAPAAVDGQAAAEHLSRAIQIKTISYRDPDQFDYTEYVRLREHLELTFPLVHATLTREVVADHSLLYTWKGQDEGLASILLMAHMDVAPIEPGTEGDWTYPPFEGHIADGHIWGRGTLDDKLSVLGLLEATEALLKEGAQPERAVYLAFGHDEEIGGQMGAAKLADLLRSRGVRPEFILDEGGFILVDAFPGMPSVAMLGIAEKGYLSLHLTVEGRGGHSSMPPPHTAVGVLSTAIHNLEANPFPIKLDGAARKMFAEYMAPELPFPMKLMFANLWFFEGGITSQLASSSPATNAWLRTTTAATMFEGSVQDNLLPAKAKAVVNFRILPGESIASTTERVRKVINDPRVKITVLEQEASEPSIVSDTGAPSFELLQRTTHEMFPNTFVTPALSHVATDTRHYRDLSDNVYRFLPVVLKADDTGGIHGTNERISVESYEGMVRFYIQLIRNSAL